jgi:phosphoribosylanthranilate isomerase
MLTLTGIDETYGHPSSLKNYSSLEYGFLLSRNQGSEYRYPSKNYLKEVPKYLNTCLHLCGPVYMQSFYSGKITDSIDKALEYLQPNRIQFNMGSTYADLKEDFWPSLLSIPKHYNLKLIFQYSKKTSFVSWVEEQQSSELLILQDKSGGRGIDTTFEQPFNKDCLVGFAGGINPSNYLSKKEEASKLSNNFWLDLETGIRDSDNKIDLKKLNYFWSLYKP